jgi:hypothetical protein
LASNGLGKTVGTREFRQLFFYKNTGSFLEGINIGKAKTVWKQAVPFCSLYTLKSYFGYIKTLEIRAFTGVYIGPFNRLVSGNFTIGSIQLAIWVKSHPGKISLLLLSNKQLRFDYHATACI